MYEGLRATPEIKTALPEFIFTFCGWKSFIPEINTISRGHHWRRDTLVCVWGGV